MKFYKEGIVTVDANDGDVPWTFENPFGEPLSIGVDLINNTSTMTVKINDSLNEVVKTYTIPMDAPMGGAVYNLFQDHIRRIAKDTYPEFDGLEEVPNEPVTQGKK